MAFVSPFFLYALPLALLPVLWHFIIRRETGRDTIASLYFMEKIYGTRSRRLLFSNWLELFLEVLFISFLILSFAKPYFQGQHPHRFYLCLDNSASSFETVKDRIEAGLLDDFWATVDDSSQVFFFDLSFVGRDEPPREVGNKKEFLNAFFTSTSIEKSKVNMSHLDQYLADWVLAPSREGPLILISDLKKNHFNRASRLPNLRVHYYDIDSHRDQVTFSLRPSAKTLQFIGEEIDLTLLAQTTKHPRSVSLEILEDEESLFVEEITLRAAREKISLPLRFEEPGYHHLRVTLTYKNAVTKREVTQEDFYTLFIAEPIDLYLQSSKRTFFLLKKMFSLDVERGHINLGDKQTLYREAPPDVALVTSYQYPNALSWLSDTPLMLFVPKGVDIKALNDFLQYHFSVTFNVTHRLFSSASTDTSKVTANLPGAFELLNNVANINNLNLEGEINVQSLGGGVISRYNGGSFLTFDKKLVLYGFDAEAKDSQFLQSAVGLSFIYQSILHLLKPFAIQHIFSGDNLGEGVFTPVVLPAEDAFNQAGGVYSNIQTFLNVHPQLEEWNAPQADLKEVFALATSLNNQDLGIIKANYFIWQWALGLAGLCLGALAFLFYRRTRQV